MSDTLLDDMLDEISQRAFADEVVCMEQLLAEMAPYEAVWGDIRNHAYTMIEKLRREGMGLSVEAFLQEYGLSSKEGVAVMCLAEALLRIPDRDTADRLIESTFDGADWEAHLGRSDSLFVNASSWGLLLTGKMLNFDKERKEGAGLLLSRLVHNTSEPVIREALRTAMRLVAAQFVLGETIEKSLKKAASFEKKGYCFSYDMLGEGARTATQAEQYFESYRRAIREVGKSSKKDAALYERPSVSIKLTALHPRYEWVNRERVVAELLLKLKVLVSEARAARICVAIDAEEAARLDLELEVFRALFLDPEFANFSGIGFVLQAYQKRAIHVIDFLTALSQEAGKRMPIRLVKGAYWDSEIKLAQAEGLDDYPVFTVKAHSDISYMACARKLLSCPEHFFPQFATHNAITIASIIKVAGDVPFEFQRLYGMGEKLYEDLAGQYPCRIYAPIGEHKDLLAYLIRRLLENGANSSFVHLIMDKNIAIEELLEDPIAGVRDSGGRAAIVPPKYIYRDDRLNSCGISFGNRVQVTELYEALRIPREIPEISDATLEQVDEAIAKADAASDGWDLMTASKRAELLEATADRLEANAGEAIYLCVKEAKKTVDDAVAELREAIDFCRYYAVQTRQLFSKPTVMDGPTGESNVLQLHGRGVFACISPWNFPLAIFLGQVTAALAAGNTVLAKPAEQTPAIAAFAVRMLHEAGVPDDVVQLVPGSGSEAGSALVKDERVAGVAFTGSTVTGKRIQRMLAERDGPIVPLVAETGGQNAMMVDSTALLEQVVDDVVHSAFGSAGQRCSALRVLYIHEDIADTFISLLDGAMQELQVGDSADFATDVGPVIDEEAQQRLVAHIEDMKQEAMLLATTPLKDEVAKVDSFVAPYAFEIQSIKQLAKEHFGPILHVIRYHPSKLDEVIADINATGFGLTFGIHSRIPVFYEAVCERVRAGNLYVNRGMTGATVGVQPFGGEGLSGTGPKAGSPYTLLRYATEKTVTVNTAAIGGNIELLIG